MFDLNQEREFIKSLGDDIGLIVDYVDYMQDCNNLRICPLNIYCDDLSKKICKNCTGGTCRQRYATCFKAYFKEKQKIDEI